LVSTLGHFWLLVHLLWCQEDFFMRYYLD